ncbi:glucosyltransferase domain-containing protein [Bacteroidales bacterium OttesenSCG-928-K03]|nr:glucosyltransferase domain-containing protein [Odoribacter sp. OttesenSCG-928-L07]MDL2238815.1 glucosyltransferase domain-containing protein [Bacteroidales bacterium OttesenSCG-928-L14]MDL2240252.1 glucosyltransferase domain-containing protein [Bacteroidales bacterium OttesenSCG-928-K22]MDL2242412.1 glucosyltransferase domain-containing protein [Bacteroidales bacterium OttesenSCG-928-K03]
MKVDTSYDNTIIKNFFNFLLFVVALITFLPLFKIGFCYAEDVAYYLTSDYSMWKEDAITYAQHSGRFYFLLVKWVYFIPYLIDSPIYFHLMRFLPLIAGIFLLFNLLKRLNFSKSFLVFALLIFFATFQIPGAASSVTSYPFFFTFAIALVLCSLHLIVSYFKTNKYYYIILSSIVMAIASLFQESFLMYYVLIFFFILLQYNFKSLFTKRNILKFAKEIMPYVIFGLIYLIVYFYYAKMHPSEYVGSQLAKEASFSDICNMLFKLIYSTSPLYTFLYNRFYLITHSSSLSTDYSFFFYLKEAGLVAYIKSFIVVFLFYISLKIFSQKENKKRLLQVLTIGTLSALLPYILLLLSSRLYEDYRPFNVTSYFSFLALFLVVASIIYLVGVLLKEKQVIYKLYCIVIAFLLFFTTLFTQYTNEFVAEDLNISNERFSIIKEFKESANIKSDDIVYVKNLFYSRTISGQHAIVNRAYRFGKLIDNYFDIEANYFSDYDKLYNIYHESNDTINIFYYAQAAKSHDTYIAIVKCKGTELSSNINDLKCNNMTIGYQSSYKKFSVSVSSADNSVLKVNNKKATSLGEMKIFNIADYTQNSTTKFYISGKDINPSSLIISNITYPSANKINIGVYEPRLQKDFAKHYEQIIVNEKKWKIKVEGKAVDKNKTFEEVLNDDAVWLIYN